MRRKMRSIFLATYGMLQHSVVANSEVNYHGFDVSKADAENWIRLAEKFLSATKDCLSKAQ